MDKYFTVMLIPERNKGVRSIRIPSFVFKTALSLSVLVALVVVVIAIDYWKLLNQTFENRHLTLENRQLKEQVQIFQMKLNSLADDLERISTLENKLRMITGIAGHDDIIKKTLNLRNPDMPIDTPPPENTKQKDYKERSPEISYKSDAEMESQQTYKTLKSMYEKKIASSLGVKPGYSYAKYWTTLNSKSFNLAAQYAKFDYRYKEFSELAKNIEENIHGLDIYLLNKDSLLKSTPTLLPASGWITSYFGPRKSPYSGQVKMHEGLDVGGPIGTPIYAPADGIVTFSGSKSGFGNVLQISHGYGLETLYAHASSLTVKKGARINRGDLLARIGNTGYSTGAHLHYEIKVNGIPVDPLYFILD